MSADRLSIEVMSGAQDGERYTFDKTPIVLGRHSDDDVYLPTDVRVSRHHARIVRDEDGYFIEDMGPQGNGSRNGTYLRGKRITTKTRLSSGDIFLLGPIHVKFNEERSDGIVPSGE